MASSGSAARVIYAEGEDERVLRAVQVALDEGLCRPTLIGRPAVLAARIQRAGLRLKLGEDVAVIDPEDDPRFRQYWEAYHQRMKRNGVTPEMAKSAVRRSNTAIGALAIELGDADAMICGMVGRFDRHLQQVGELVGLAPGARQFATMNALMLEQMTLFIADTFVNDDPDAEALADIAAMAAEEVRRFGLPPKLAFVSHSMFGSSTRPSAVKMRRAHELFAAAHPEVECDGEMHGDAALSESVRRAFLPDSKLSGAANLLVLPTLDAANILFNVLKISAGQGVTVGPILLGAARPVHILTPSATVRRIVNMTALAVADVREARLQKG